MNQHALHTLSIKELFNMFKWVPSHVLSENAAFNLVISRRTRYHMGDMVRDASAENRGFRKRLNHTILLLGGCRACSGDSKT